MHPIIETMYNKKILINMTYGSAAGSMKSFTIARV